MCALGLQASAQTRGVTRVTGVTPLKCTGVTAQTANGACSADLSSRLTGSCGWTITVTSGGRVILGVLDAIFGTKVYLCPRIKNR